MAEKRRRRERGEGVKEKISDLLSFEFLTKSVCGGASHKHIDLKAKDMCNIGR